MHKTVVPRQTSPLVAVGSPDFYRNAVREMEEELRRRQADTKPPHLKGWNVQGQISGLSIRDCDLLLDEPAGEVYGNTDPMEERAGKQVGGTVRSIGDLGRWQRWEESGQKLGAAGEMFAALYRDIGGLPPQPSDRHEVWERNPDGASTRSNDGRVEQAERRTWRLSEARSPMIAAPNEGGELR